VADRRTDVNAMAIDIRSNLAGSAASLYSMFFGKLS